jgi:hypothetical protein
VERRRQRQMCIRDSPKSVSANLFDKSISN